MTLEDPPRLVVCPVCGVTYPDHTGGASLEHLDEAGGVHVWTPGPLPDDVAWVPWWDGGDDDGGR
jgi:hypothetical protein